MKKRKSSYKKELLMLAVFIPAIFVVTAVSAYLALQLAKTNSKICNFVGHIWLTGDPADPNVREGCFSYEEVYEYNP